MRQFLAGTESNCQYDNWLSHLAEGIALPGYNTYAPYDVQTDGFGDFRVPTAAELEYWEGMLSLFNSGDYDGAQALLDLNSAPFQIIRFTDTDTGRIYYMIREIPDFNYSDDNRTTDTYDDEHGAFTYGWGLFIYNPGGTKPIIVSVAHPCDDFPAPRMGLLALEAWNARYLMINGAGREVRWTNEGTYTNSKSISDPSRYAQHPFQAAYKRFADQIRSDFSTLEFSAQIHSYDWNQHAGYANCQISAGNPRPCPNLPIRDLSLLKHDLINNGDHLMLPANTVGTHPDVYLNDFYAVNYSVHPFTFSDGERTYAVNNRIDLPAYSQNRQMLYTQSGTTDYDVYEPFFHIEQDELPNAYAQTEATYNWFWGWNELESRWDMAGLFDNFLSYYSRWIHDLEPMLVEMFQMDDGSAPTAPSALNVTSNTETSVTLAWSLSSDYDFDSYELLFATEPIGEANYQVYDRADNEYLASQGCAGITISGLAFGGHYYFQVRARDKNGNYSDLSNQVDIELSEAVFSYAPAAVDFGQVWQNSAPVWVDVTVTNTGYGTLELHPEDVYLLGPGAAQFTVDRSQLPATLGHQGSVLIPVCLNTAAIGIKTATLRLASNARVDHDVPLSGEVLPEGMIQIGTGNISTYNLPIQPDYGYSYSQSIFLSSEIGGTDTYLHEIYYYWNGAAAASASNTWVVYLGHTTKTAFANKND